MSVKWRTRHDDISKMTRTLEGLDGHAVEVGVLGGEHAWLAAIHEYGCTIQVTPKMRAYLHAHGLHLSETTRSIKIPERSFLRAGYDANVDEVMERARQVVAAAAQGDLTARAALEVVGALLRDRIRDYARDLSDPPNRPYTRKQKGSSNPLVDTGDMIGGIEWRESR